MACDKLVPDQGKKTSHQKPVRQNDSEKNHSYSPWKEVKMAINCIEGV